MCELGKKSTIGRNGEKGRGKWDVEGLGKKYWRKEGRRNRYEGDKGQKDEEGLRHERNNFPLYCSRLFTLVF
jgi:hypothetical protein